MADQTPQPTNDPPQTPVPEQADQQQDEMRRRMIEQQRRMRCVGCGEGEEIF